MFYELALRPTTGDAARAGDGGKNDPEWLVLDTVGNFDGLERLIVIAVGLDAPISDHGAAGGDDDDVPRAEGGGADALEVRRCMCV